jgi:hypothetical protein
MLTAFPFYGWLIDWLKWWWSCILLLNPTLLDPQNIAVYQTQYQYEDLKYRHISEKTITRFRGFCDYLPYDIHSTHVLTVLSWQLGTLDIRLQGVQNNWELGKKRGPTGENRTWVLFLERRLSDLNITDVMIWPRIFPEFPVVLNAALGTRDKNRVQIMTSVIFRTEF